MSVSAGVGLVAAMKKPALTKVAIVAALSALTLAAGSASVALATVHEPEMCWVPDFEFPVPCDADE